MKKNCKKSKKTYFGAILGPFYPNLGKNEFSWKKQLYQFLDIPIIYHCTKNQQKLLSNFRGKHQTDGQTDRQRDDCDFIRPSVGKFFRITCLVHKIVQNLNSPLPLVWKCMHLRTPSNMHISFYLILYFYQNIAQRCQKYSRMLLLFSLFHCKYIQKLNLNLRKI